MKKSVKTAFAAVCVAVAGIGAFNAYDEQSKNLATSDVLLAENVEALSAGDGWGWLGDLVGGLLGGSSDKWYRAQYNAPCQFHKSIDGKDTLVNGTKVGCENTKAETAGCTIPSPNPCVE